MSDHKKLRELAETFARKRWYVVEAPWGEGDFVVAGNPDPHGATFVADCRHEDPDGEEGDDQQRAAWIAATCPAAVLPLLDEIDELTKQANAAASVVADDYGEIKRLRVENRKALDEIAKLRAQLAEACDLLEKQNLKLDAYRIKRKGGIDE